MKDRRDTAAELARLKQMAHQAIDGSGVCDDFGQFTKKEVDETLEMAKRGWFPLGAVINFLKRIVGRTAEHARDVDGVKPSRK